MSSVMIMGDDAHARAVEGFLLGVGIPVVRFSSNSNWHITGDDSYLEIKLPGSGRLYGAGDIRSFYWRCYDGCGPCLTDVAQQNRVSMFESWLKHLDDEIPCYNGYAAWRLHGTKPYQNGVMFDLLDGQEWIQMPRSNYGVDIRRYARKGAQGGCHAVPPMAEFDPQVYPCSQMAIQGVTIRAYAFHDEVIAYQVDSDQFDYRLDRNPSIVNTSLSHDANLVLRELIYNMGWMWAGMDLICDRDGIYHLLDCNPSPMFLGFEGQEHLVLRALAEHLNRECDEEDLCDCTSVAPCEADPTSTSQSSTESAPS